MTQPSIAIVGAAETTKMGKVPELSQTGLHADAALNAIADCGLTVSLDCAWNDDLPEGIAQLASQVDVFLPNAAEMARLQETGFDLSSVPLAVVKQGAHGATAHRRGAEPVSVPARYADVVDPTGAGDAFNAGFLDGWLKGWPLGDCLAQGNMCGAAAVECMGGATAARVVGAQAEAPRQRQVQQ